MIDTKNRITKNMNQNKVLNLKNHIIESVINQSQSIDLTNPINLYITNEQADIYLDTINSKQFQRQLHFPIKQLISKHAESILKETSENIDIIDLGPGLPDKTSSIIDYVKSYKEKLRYIPVDISKTFLDLSVNYFKYKKINIIPINCLFSQLPEILETDNRFNNIYSRLFILGLTFNNFSIDEMSTLFSKLLDNRSFGLIATEFLDDISLENVLKPYQTNKAQAFNFQMLKEVGLNIIDFKYNVEFVNNKILMSFISEKDISFGDVNIKKGTAFLTSISYRYSMNELIQMLENKLNVVEVIKNGKSKISLLILKTKNHD